jgi:hypothetical protein
MVLTPQAPASSTACGTSTHRSVSRGGYPGGDEPSRSARRGQIVAGRFVESAATAARRSASRRHSRRCSDRGPTARSVENLELVSARVCRGEPSVTDAPRSSVGSAHGAAWTSGRWAAATRAQASAVRASRQHGEQRLRPDAPHGGEMRSPRTGVRARLASSAIGPGATRSGRRMRRAIARRPRPADMAPVRQRCSIAGSSASETCGVRTEAVTPARRPPRSTSRAPYGRRRCPFDAAQGRQVQSHFRPLGRIDDAHRRQSSTGVPVSRSSS